MSGSTVANFVVVVVTMVWVASFVLSVVSTVYRPDPQIHLLFGSVVGAFMALGARKSGGGG